MSNLPPIVYKEGGVTLDNGMSNQYNHTVQALSIAILSRTPSILWGPPGVGKTSVLNSIAKHYGMHLEVVMANIREPSDFAGLPSVQGDQVNWIAPSWVKHLIDNHENNHKVGMVFYDEISTARPATQAAMLRPILEGVVGDTHLPPNVITVAAANPPDSAADGWDLSEPSANRFTHFDWTLTAADIHHGFTKGWEQVILPQLHKSYKERITHAMILVGSFVGANPYYANLRMKEQRGEFTASSMAFPTARSWETVAKLYGTAKSARFVLPSGESYPMPQESIEKLILGTVGEDAGTEFMHFLDALDLPDPREVLANPKGFTIPHRQDVLYTLLTSIENAVTNGNDTIEEPEWKQWGSVLARIVQEGYADIAYVFGKEWMKYRPSGAILDPEYRDTFSDLFRRLGVE